jgi:hypothetical protein
MKVLTAIVIFVFSFSVLSQTIEETATQFWNAELYELIDHSNHQTSIYILQLNEKFYQIKIGTGKLGTPLPEGSDLMERVLNLKHF